MTRLFFSFFVISILLVSCAKTHQPSGIIKVVKDEKTVIEAKKTLAYKHSVVKNSRENNPLVGEFEIEKQVKNYELDYAYDTQTSDVINNLLRAAYKYKGTRYRIGGMSTAGIDCSGLMVCTFKELDIHLPRTSSEQARMGRRISKGEINKGDLVFFVTRGHSISHVGLVTESTNGDIKFIHASTSQGVIESSLNEDYWANRFTHASRIL